MRQAAEAGFGRTLPEVLAVQAAVRPSGVAVWQGGRRVSFAELDERVSAVAAWLRGRGVAAETPVGVCLPRCPELVVAALGVMRAGGAFLPLDPGAPLKRLEGIVEAAGAGIVITEADLGEVAGVGEPAGVGPDQLAYIVHTSGSTGTPKGVMVEHGRFLAHCREVAWRYGIGSTDRVLMTCPPFVDVALEQLGVSVLTGATLVLASAQPWSPAELPDVVAEYGVTVVDLPPVAWRDMLEKVVPDDPRLGSLRLVNVGTDAVRAGDAWRWFDLGGRARFVVSYGPTESVVTATLHGVEPEVMPRGDAHAVLPIGREVAGRVGYVLDEELRRVPEGELYLGGVGLARGYLGQPALTAQRFVPDPFSAVPGARMYRTGDRVRRGPDGVLEFLGRVDRQVKVDGFRVELGEVEACLLRHPRVKTVAVVANPRLSAYVVPDGDVAVDDLRAHVREHLPAYMVPAQWTVLGSLPLTANGKVDLRALPAPGAAADTVEGAAGPIADIWRAVLGLTRVELDDDFFDLGGTSLLATRVHTRLQDAFGIGLPLRVMFEATTVRQLATVVEDAVTEEVAGLSEAELAALLGDDVAAVEPEPKPEPRERRLPGFEVSLRITGPDFLPVQGMQRDWLIERTLEEFTDTLRHLDSLSRRFVPGATRPVMSAEWGSAGARYSDAELVIDGQEVMQAWERPLMDVLAGHVAEGGGDVLEVGFGMGISASCVQARGVRSHTVIEANAQVAEQFARWRARYPDRRIELVRGRWQDVIGGLGLFDAILFDTYPTTEAEFHKDALLSVTFAESFFPAAAAHLRPGGVFSYYTNEIDSMSRAHQRSLLRHFTSFSVEVVTGLEPPADCSYWWADSMVAVKAIR